MHGESALSSMPAVAVAGAGEGRGEDGKSSCMRVCRLGSGAAAASAVPRCGHPLRRDPTRRVRFLVRRLRRCLVSGSCTLALPSSCPFIPIDIVLRSYCGGAANSCGHSHDASAGVHVASPDALGHCCDAPVSELVHCGLRVSGSATSFTSSFKPFVCARPRALGCVLPVCRLRLARAEEPCLRRLLVSALAVSCV